MFPLVWGRMFNDKMENGKKARHEMRKRTVRVIAILTSVLLVASGSFTALPRVRAEDGPGVVLNSLMLQDSEPVTYTTVSFEEVLTLDPQRTEDTGSIVPVENLFLGLVDIDPKTADVRPEMATKWDRSEDGKTWTFTLRDDVPWVRYDPDTKETTELRKVTAGDFEYGIKRICDPRLGAYYTSVAAAVVEGCDTVSRLSGEIKDSDFDQIAVKALSDTQLQITTRGSFGYFLSIAGMWMFRAVPREIIAEFGDSWTDPGKIVTNGPYVIDGWDQTTERVYVTNTLYPANITERYGGNVERVIELVSPSAEYALYQNGEVDVAYAPLSELNAIRQDAVVSKELVQRIDLATFYFGFMYDKPPFDDVHVRRAFSAILDRRQFVDEQVGGLGVPIAHFMPPGIRGAVGLNEVGLGTADNLGFDPEYAKKEMDASPYPNCENFPDVTILTYMSADSWGTFVATAAEQYLGCDKSKFIIESAAFGQLLKTIKRDVPTAQRPNMFTLGWQADYPDAQNWMHDVLSCKADNPFKRPCNANDEKIDAAATEGDPDKRVQMYQELETAFFATDGEFPIAPMYVDVNMLLIKPWVKGFFETDGQFGGPHFDAIQIDQAAQAAGRVGTTP